MVIYKDSSHNVRKELRRNVVTIGVCGVPFARHGSRCLHWTNPLHPHDIYGAYSLVNSIFRKGNKETIALINLSKRNKDQRSSGVITIFVRLQVSNGEHKQQENQTIPKYNLIIWYTRLIYELMQLVIRNSHISIISLVCQFFCSRKRVRLFMYINGFETYF